MAAPSWEHEPGACYSGFGNIKQFAAVVNGVPVGYLPVGFGCPFLEMADGEVDALGKASEAYSYLGAALGIVASLQKRINTVHQRPAEGLLAIDNDPETSEVELNCRLCSHEKAAEINKALQDARSLRDIETEYNISRSTLSRHKNRCLNLGVIRIVD